MKTLIFDTETSGLPTSYKAAFSDTNAWPRIVEIAWIILDENLYPLSSSSFIVRPDGFFISEGASSVHGITTEKAKFEGSPLRYVLACFAEDLSEINRLVAHNIDFDFPVVNCEFLRSGIASTLPVKERYCTMKSTINLCNLPGKYGLKWPKLQELYRFLFDRNFAEAHRAMNDVSATTECYLDLVKRGLA
jgi:DNA polymerase III subunit epsilon